MNWYRCVHCRRPCRATGRAVHINGYAMCIPTYAAPMEAPMTEAELADDAATWGDHLLRRTP